MPYTSEHKAGTRHRIVSAARRHFVRRGFGEATIDEIMADAGLTRGGFYNHFSSKDALYAEAIASFAGEVHMDAPPDAPAGFVAALVGAYLSDAHLARGDGQCPLIALSSDTARSAMPVREAFTGLLAGMAGAIEHELAADHRPGEARARALTIAALCIGGMTLARTVADPALADEIRETARRAALAAAEPGTAPAAAQ